MELDNFVPFVMPPSGRVIIQVMSQMCFFLKKKQQLNTKTAIPKPFRKQDNAFILRLEIAYHYAHILKIYEWQ